MTVEDCAKQYTLRVMVNVGPNCFHFKYLDDKAFNFFFDQVNNYICSVCVYVCVCARVRICVYVRICVCMYVYACVYIQACWCVHVCNDPLK